MGILNEIFNFARWFIGLCISNSTSNDTSCFKGENKLNLI